MPRIRVIASAAIGCLFVCGLFGGLGVAQTASTEPVGKPMQLLHAGKSETKPTEGSAAKHSSKAHPVAKKRASTKPASKENTSIGAPQVTALPSELVIDGKAVRVGLTGPRQRHRPGHRRARRTVAGSGDRRDGGEHRDDRASGRVKFWGRCCPLTDAEQQYRKHVLAAVDHRRAERRGGDRFACLVPDRAQLLS